MTHVTLTSKTSTDAADGEHWSKLPRTCGLCGGQDIPRGRLDWPWWVEGKPAHFLCASLYEMTREKLRRLEQQDREQNTLYRLVVFSERMTIVKPHDTSKGGADGGFA